MPDAHRRGPHRGCLPLPRTGRQLLPSVRRCPPHDFRRLSPARRTHASGRSPTPRRKRPPRLPPALRRTRLPRHARRFPPNPAPPHLPTSHPQSAATATRYSRPSPRPFRLPIPAARSSSAALRTLRSRSPVPRLVRAARPAPGRAQPLRRRNRAAKVPRSCRRPPS